MEDTKQSNDATAIKITVEVDSSEIDVAIEKAKLLKALMCEIKDTAVSENE